MDWLEQRDAYDPDELKQSIETLANRAEPSHQQAADALSDRFRPFPVDALPELLRRFVLAASEAIGCDPSYVALPILATLASAIGNTRRLQLKPGWHVPPILWAVVVGESGTAKTPASRPVRRLIQDKQESALQRHHEAMTRYESELARWDKELTAWKRDKHTTDEPPAKPEPPRAERFVVSDTTVEALAPLLLANPRGLLLARDELAGWIGSFDRYAGSQGADAAHWLSMHSGESIIVDRKTGHPKTIYVPRAAVCITGSIQPGVLHRALGTEHRESGLAARLLVSCPPRQPKQWTEAGIDPLLECEMGVALDRLYDLESDLGEDGEPRPAVVQLTPTAKQRWIEFYNQHNRQQVALTGELAAAWSKLEECAARLALVIHFVRVVADDRTIEAADAVDAGSMSAGVRLARWFGEEAKRVFGMLSESDEDREQRELIELIERRGGRITPRELAQNRRRYQPTSAAEDALNELVQSSHGRWETVPTSTKPRREFALTVGVSTIPP